MSRHANDIIQLHGPQRLVDKTNFDLVLYNHAAPQYITVQLPISKRLGEPCIVVIASFNAYLT